MFHDFGVKRDSLSNCMHAPHGNIIPESQQRTGWLKTREKDKVAAKKRLTEGER